MHEHYHNLRHTLQSQLRELAEAPDLLLFDEIVDRLHSDIDRFQEAFVLARPCTQRLRCGQDESSDGPMEVASPLPPPHQEVIIEEEVAQEVEARVSLVEEGAQESEHDSAEQEGVTLDLASLRESFERAPETWTQPAGDRFQLQDATHAQCHTLPELFESTAKIESLPCIEGIELLERWIHEPTLLQLDHAALSSVAHFLAAAIRFVQDMLCSYDQHASKPRFKVLIEQLIERYKPHVGRIYGLALHDVPLHGESWLGEMAHHKAQALECFELKQPLAPSQKKRRTKDNLTQGDVTAGQLPDELDARYRGAFMERRVLCIGGKEKPPQVEEWFSPRSFTWIKSERSKSKHPIEKACKKIASGKVDVVCLMLRAIGHSKCDRIVKECKKTKGIHLIYVEEGFGPVAWCEAIEKASPPLLHKLDDE